MHNYTSINIKRSALIIIDMQNDFVLEHGAATISGTLAVVPAMQEAIQAYRAKGLPIVHIIRLYKADGSNVDLCRRATIENGASIVLPHSYGAEIVDSLRPQPDTSLDAEKLLRGDAQQIANNEYVFYKPRWGAFYQTALEQFLKSRDIDSLVFLGCNYPNCPRSSIYQASERDFRLGLLTDAVSQLYPKGEEEMKNIGVNLFSVCELLRLLE